jgi:transcriptional regulator with XRE-family HTH domain
MTEPALTPKQLLEARKLLRWSRDRLSVRLGISISPIASFENSGVISKTFDIRRTREVLEAAGVEFIGENGGELGVRLRKA